MTLYAGIDPGLHGALVVLDEHGAPQLVWAADDKGGPVPGYLVGDFDARSFVAEIRALTGRWRPLVIETPMIMARQKGALAIGANYGQLLACLQLADVPYVRVTPAAWSRSIIGSPPTGGWADGAKKQAAVDSCRRELPQLGLVAPGKRVPHTGIADAGCMALWAMRQGAR